MASSSIVGSKGILHSLAVINNGKGGGGGSSYTAICTIQSIRNRFACLLSIHTTITNTADTRLPLFLTRFLLYVFSFFIIFIFSFRTCHCSMCSYPSFSRTESLHLIGSPISLPIRVAPRYSYTCPPVYGRYYDTILRNSGRECEQLGSCCSPDRPVACAVDKQLEHTHRTVF